MVVDLSIILGAELVVAAVLATNEPTRDHYNSNHQDFLENDYSLLYVMCMISFSTILISLH